MIEVNGRQFNDLEHYRETLAQEIANNVAGQPTGLNPEYVRPSLPVKTDSPTLENLVLKQSRTETIKNLAPEFSAAVEQMYTDAPADVKAGVRGVNFGWRSNAEQTRLYNDWVNGRSNIPAAKPGTSKHEIGRAVDFDGLRANPKSREWFHENAPNYGLKFGRGKEQHHVEWNRRELKAPDQKEQVAAARRGTGTLGAPPEAGSVNKGVQFGPPAPAARTSSRTAGAPTDTRVTRIGSAPRMERTAGKAAEATAGKVTRNAYMMDEVPPRLAATKFDKPKAPPAATLDQRLASAKKDSPAKGAKGARETQGQMAAARSMRDPAGKAGLAPLTSNSAPRMTAVAPPALASKNVELQGKAKGRGGVQTASMANRGLPETASLKGRASASPASAARGTANRSVQPATSKPAGKADLAARTPDSRINSAAAAARGQPAPSKVVVDRAAAAAKAAPATTVRATTSLPGGKPSLTGSAKASPAVGARAAASRDLPPARVTITGRAAAAPAVTGTAKASRALDVKPTVTGGAKAAPAAVGRASSNKDLSPKATLTGSAKASPAKSQAAVAASANRSVQPSTAKSSPVSPAAAARAASGGGSTAKPSQAAIASRALNTPSVSTPVQRMAATSVAPKPAPPAAAVQAAAAQRAKVEQAKPAPTPARTVAPAPAVTAGRTTVPKTSPISQQAFDQRTKVTSPAPRMVSPTLDLAPKPAPKPVAQPVIEARMPRARPAPAPVVAQRPVQQRQPVVQQQRPVVQQRQPQPTFRAPQAPAPRPLGPPPAPRQAETRTYNAPSVGPGNGQPLNGMQMVQVMDPSTGRGTGEFVSVGGYTGASGGNRDGTTIGTTYGQPGYTGYASDIGAGSPASQAYGAGPNEGRSSRR